MTTKFSFEIYFVIFIGTNETENSNILTKTDVYLILEEIKNHKFIENIVLLNTKLEDDCSLTKLLVASENHPSLKSIRFIS